MRTEPVIAWVLTYALHSTLLLLLAWALTRKLVQSHGARDLIWKTALVGGLVSSTVQLAAGVVPVGGRFSIAQETIVVPQGRSDGRTVGRPAPFNTTGVAPDQADHPQAPVAEAESTVRPPDRPTVSFPKLRPTVLLLVLWGAVAAFLAIQFLAAQFLLVVRVGRRALVRDEQMLEVLDVLREEAGIKRHIRLTRAEGLPSPVALGMSEICIPDAALTELDREQQESMLAHELAHLARKDPAWLVAGCLIERVFFFQPLNRLARRRIQEAAEYLCDDWAVRRSGSGLTLAKCLVKVAEWIDTTPEPVPVSGMAEMRSHFVSRIHRLIANHALSAPPVRRWLAPAALAAVAVLVAAAPGVTAAPSATKVSLLDQTVAAAGRSDGRTLDSLARDNANSQVVSRTERNFRTSTRTNAETRTSPETVTVRPSDRPTVSDVPSAAEERILAIAQGRDTSAVTALIAALKDEDPEVRRAAANALGNRRDPRAVPALINALADSDAEVRSHVVEALANLRDPRATDGLIKALKDENPEVRSHAAQGLGEMPGAKRGYTAEAQRAADALAAVLNDVSAEVRRQAIEALKDMRGIRMADAMITALKDQDADVRQSAAEALGDMEARNAGQQLIAALADPSADVRHAAAHALGHLKDQQSAEALAKALKDSDHDVRQAAAEALGELEMAQAPQGLLDAMHDENGDVRQQAVEAVGNIRDPRAVPALTQLINDTDPDVREAAVEALSEIRDAASVDALVKAMQSKDPSVRKRAAEALGERN
jgi:HEAT repeat protein/beta-lactamase regulating signal transducer with metallopeptidase domain